MHVRPVREVLRSAEVRVAEGLDVRDLRRAEPCLLRGRETKEELRSVRNELSPRDACGEGHLLRKAGTTVEASSDEPLANARDVEETAQLVEDRRRTDAMWSSESLRSRTATSFDSRIMGSGSVGKRIESSSTRTSCRLVADARRSTGRCLAA